MFQPKDVRIEILLLIPIVWLFFFLYSDFWRDNSADPASTEGGWDIENLKILPHQSAQADILKSVFQLEKIPVNGADTELLAVVPGIGPELAGRIVEDRNRFGRFENPEDLQRVRGIGPRRADQFGSYLSFD